jgi:DNA-binding CsgD family transcriptional regulator
LRTRRGDGDAVGALRESLGILQRQGFRQREGLIRGALAEAAWQAGDVDAVMAEVEEGLALALRFRQPWYVGELGYWAWRAGRPVELPEWAAEPYRLQIAGLWDEAAGHWLAMGCPYEQARALAEGDSSGRADAVEILQRLGAGPALRALRRHPRSVSLDELAARPRLAGLTTRQSLVADLIAEGLTNVEIAAHLKLSVKTVDHHVAAILARFDVADRGAAARLTRAARARA